jgi:Zn-dependent metalloprotease
MAKGMMSIRMHRQEGGMEPTLAAARTAVLGAPAPESLDPETAARRVLSAILGPTATALAPEPRMNEEAAEYKSLGVDRIPFTGSQHVKFRQYFHKIPVYGSLVTIELDERNEFVSINTALGDPSNLDPVAKISPETVLKRIRKWAGYGDQPLDRPARLYFYYDPKAARWRLTYIVEDVLRMKPQQPSRKESVTALPEVSDFVVDAHTGELVDEMPRTQNMAQQDRLETAGDGLGQQRQIGIVFDDVTNDSTLHDRTRHITTHDFAFEDAFFRRFSLPGRLVNNPPAPWDAGGVSAHSNAKEVIDFLRDVLQRDGLDGMGGEVVSTVNCVFQSNGATREWRNAARFLGQMIYGQRLVNGQLRSYAVALDVVAHELLHGLTENTARLEYRNESGALNESYSDIFGVVVANRAIADVDAWNWEIGEDLTETGLPIRDMRDPTRFNQPAHMRDFVVLPDTPLTDHGGVHTNSGIHNRAAFNVFSAESPSGAKIFAPLDVARLYYVTLVAHLSRTSEFSDCRAGMILATQSMFGSDPALQAKVDAIAAAYSAVGIE